MLTAWQYMYKRLPNTHIIVQYILEAWHYQTLSSPHSVQYILEAYHYCRLSSTQIIRVQYILVGGTYTCHESI